MATYDDVKKQTLDAANQVTVLRSQATQMQAQARIKRAAMHEKLHAFNRCFGQPNTREQLIRDHIKSQQEQKRRIARGEELPQRRDAIANSAIDRQRAYSSGGTADDFARSTFQHGNKRAIALDNDGNPQPILSSRYRGRRVRVGGAQ